VSLPRRPRLAGHVLPRRHVVDGDERVVLHDLSTGRLVQIGLREWGLLASADGTRDVDGIVLAAAREGAHARAPAVEAFLIQLHAAGMIDDGTAAPPAPPAPPADEGEGEDPVLAAARPLFSLPGYSLHCDGSGSCCRFYATVVFGPVEAARARALCPEVLGGGARHERVFMPERGSGPTGGAAVAYRDGRCAYLGPDDRCAIHAAGGPLAKPLGCRTFPASFLDDGETVRVSVSVECACVLASVDRPGGAPLVSEGARVRADLDETLVVDRLADHLLITPARVASRAAFLAWSRAVTRLFPDRDVPAALLALAGAVEAAGLDEDAAGRALASPPPVDPAAIAPFAAALAARAARRAAEDTSYRSERDLVLRGARWVAEAARALADPDLAAALLAAPPAAPRAERFYVAALLHGHRLAGARPLATALRDRAARVLVARALGLVLAAVPEPERDPAAAYPLALLEALLRGHGLDAYVDDLES
jgi:lysine-N-methylase